MSTEARVPHFEQLKHQSLQHLRLELEAVVGTLQLMEVAAIEDASDVEMLALVRTWQKKLEQEIAHRTRRP